MIDRARFMSKVWPDAVRGCWFWQAGLFDNGYGAFRVDGQNTQAHRVSYKLHNGPIPEGKVVCHSCDRKSCVNPDHLWLGTTADNNADRNRKFRHSHGEKHWKNKLTAEQVLEIRASSDRDCDISRRFGVSQAHIYRVKKRLAWSHI